MVSSTTPRLNHSQRDPSTQNIHSSSITNTSYSSSHSRSSICSQSSQGLANGNGSSNRTQRRSHSRCNSIGCGSARSPSFTPPCVYPIDQPYSGFTTVPHKLRRELHLRLQDQLALETPWTLLQEQQNVQQSQYQHQQQPSRDADWRDPSDIPSTVLDNNTQTASRSKNGVSLGDESDRQRVILNQIQQLHMNIASRAAAIDMLFSQSDQTMKPEPSESISRLMQLRPDMYISDFNPDDLHLLKVITSVRLDGLAPAAE
ncbi:hypothetical protein BASA60_002688 [Batrachochytrium salamandrivorans]|nr:hypothetical protein BASA60_002688 [Batrachochytrium salamandrivorans]